MATDLLGLGLVELSLDKSLARAHILASLSLRREMGAQLAQTSTLIVVAGLAMREANPQIAARLLGAVKSSLQTLHAVVEPEMLYFYRETATAVPAAVNDKAFHAAWEDGRKLSLVRAVELAQEIVQPKG